MEFILDGVIFTKIVSQVIIIKKIVIIEKDHDYWKKNVIIEKDHDYQKRLWLLKFSSNINEVIRAVLFFFTTRFHKHEKAPKALKV